MSPHNVNFLCKNKWEELYWKIYWTRNVFTQTTLLRIIDVIWSKEKKEKIFVINECICAVSETDFASDIDFRKTSCDPKYIATNCSDHVSWCIEQNTLKM